MKAAYYLAGRIEVGDAPDPVPGKGQALVRTHSCGLCASDVHFLRSGEKLVKLSREYGGPYAGLDLNKLFVPGHEYVGEVVDYGPGSRRPIKPGRRVTSVPIMRQSGAHGVVGYHNDCPGGFGEYMLLDEDFLMEVPEELMVFSAQNKRLTILFAAGEEKQDMELALRSIADGTIDVSSWLGGRIGLTGVADALAAMSNPSAPIRTVVDPRRM